LEYDQLIYPAMENGKALLILDEDNQPLGFCTWAFLSEKSARDYANGYGLTAEDFESDEGEFWIIDFVAPYDNCRAIVRIVREFMKDRYGIVYYSPLWLFYSLMSKFTFMLRDYIRGMKRGIMTENYYAYLVEQDITRSYPNAKLKGPYKLILKNNNTSSRTHGNNIYQQVKKMLSKIKFECLEYELPLNVMRKKDFVEIDFIMLINDTLLVIEVKDDIFWDISDLPYILIRWGHNLNEKLNHELQ
jgi:hypothetical protein